MAHRHSLTQRGFSLVELSIVLVILGLLVGGVLSGQSLIRAAELRSVSSDLARYEAAVNTFRDKYLATPGDMPNATKFWGSVTASGNSCPAEQGSGKQTCDGNGDGYAATVAGGWGDAYERFRFWQHLANAGLIEGSYTGVGNGTYGTSVNHVAGENAPQTKMANATYSVFGSGRQSGTSGSFDGDYGNVIEFRKNGGAGYEILKPEEQWGIDKKLDDGMPGQGRIRSYTGEVSSTAHCTTKPGGGTVVSGDGAVATYDLSYTSLACSVWYDLGS